MGPGISPGSPQPDFPQSLPMWSVCSLTPGLGPGSEHPLGSRFSANEGVAGLRAARGQASAASRQRTERVPISPPSPRARRHLIGDLGSQRGMELAEKYAFDAAAAAHGANGTESSGTPAPRPWPLGQARLCTRTLQDSCSIAHAQSSSEAWLRRRLVQEVPVGSRHTRK